MDQAALQACGQAAGKISTLSRERITQELLKILAVPDVAETLQIMFENGVLKELYDDNYSSPSLQKLSALQANYGGINVMARLFMVAGSKPKFFEDILRLSHAQKNFLIKLDMVTRSDFYHDERALKKAIFYHGNDLLLQGYLFAAATGQVEEDHSKIDLIQNWQAPECPITGETLIAEGYQTGPELGQELKRRQEEWLTSEL